ncbi:MAG: CRISPR-associated protein CasA/Cse1 [Dehalococcoidia bacterium]|nr:MAG: CRISPR-associated protein CasA/Cse1 [Dehalococcoidia bacterium]
MFDLIEAPWIPVVQGDGTVREVGLREALVSAHAFRGVRDPWPTIEFGVYRLLTAVSLDLLFGQEEGPPDRYRLFDTIEAGRFDRPQVEQYFDRYRDLFDLFSPSRPFLQSPGLDQLETKPVALLVHAIPSGTNANHFYHRQEREFAVSPAVAARLLTTLAPFTTEGGRGYSPSVNGAPPWYVLIKGDTLFETICLNLLAPEELPGVPAWRNPAPPGGEKRTTTTYAEALTWRPRRVRLLPDKGGICAVTGIESTVLVREMQFGPGDSWGDSPRWTDPNAAYRTTAQGTSAIRPTEGRALFRDLGPLALKRQTETTNVKVRFERPLVVSQYERLVDDNVLPADRDLRLVVYGMRVEQKSKVYEWQREELPPLSFSTVHDPRVGTAAQGAIERAEDGAFALRAAISRLAGKNASGIGTLVAQAHQIFWSALEPPYVHLVRALGRAYAANNLEAVEQALAEFDRTLRLEAWRAFDEVVEPFDATGRMLERVTTARGDLAARLNRLGTGGPSKKREKEVKNGT